MGYPRASRHRSHRLPVADRPFHRQGAGVHLRVAVRGDQDAEETGAIPFDVPGVEMTHVGEGCSFDTFVQKYGLDNDLAIRTIAAIVRGADTDRHDLTPQSAGLLAISMGLRDLSPDDHEVLRHGFVIYDALYAWASKRRDETHSWPPASTKAA